MKAALIAPVPMLRAFGFGSLHLCLDEVAKHYPSYRAYYRERAILGDHIILDNSAHEHGHGNDHAGLLKRAKLMLASEIVCPDELFSDTGTIDRTSNALIYFKESEDVLGKIRLMMVPQAPLEEEGIPVQALRSVWDDCLQMLCKMHEETFPGRPFTIGISKDYEVWPGGLYDLIHNYVWPARQEYGFDVHLLGWGRNLGALQQLRQDFPWIRSVDSAKPFVYGYRMIPIDPLNPPKYPGRPENYFDLVFNQGQSIMSYYNAFVFKAAAGDTVLSSGYPHNEGMRLEGIMPGADLWKS